MIDEAQRLGAVRALDVLRCNLCGQELCDGGICGDECPNNLLPIEERPEGSIAIYHYKLTEIVPYHPLFSKDQSANGTTPQPVREAEESANI
jgi:hypothetical protein